MVEIDSRLHLQHYFSSPTQNVVEHGRLQKLTTILMTLIKFPSLQTTLLYLGVKAAEVVVVLLPRRGRGDRSGRLFPLPVAILGLFLRLLLFPTL